VVVESDSLPSDCVVWFPVTAIAAVVPGGISVESIRPTAASLTAAVVVGIAVVTVDGLSAEFPQPLLTPAAAMGFPGGISTTMTSCDASITVADLRSVVAFSASSAV